MLPTLRLPLALGAIVLSLGLSACTPGSDTEDALDPDSSHSPGEDWDLDPDDLIALWEDLKVELAKQYSIESPPEVELVRFVTAEEWASAQVGCLTAQGVGVTEGPQGGILFSDAPREQADTINLAAFICAASYPVDPRTQVPLPRVRAELQYDHLVEEVAPCVERELGIDVSEPPSFETWLEQYYAGTSYWDPYAEVLDEMEPGSSALDEAYELCPHDAPDLYPAVSP